MELATFRYNLHANVRTTIKLLAFSILLAPSACRFRSDANLNSATTTDPSVVSFTILQINDVYEINPVEGGTQGGLARVATLKNELLQENPNLITVLPGDFLSPSAMGATTVAGEPVAGKQMIETLNALGIDYVSFGNHEFDLTEPRLLARMSESKFKWIGTNVRDKGGAPFPLSVDDAVISFHNASGAEAKLSLFSICTDMVKKPFVQYLPAISTAQAEVARLASTSDVVIALTHLPIAEDKEVAQQVPRIDVVLGGHEHVNTAVEAGSDHTPIFKADANARTVYVHRMKYNTATKNLVVDSTLVPMDSSVALDPAVTVVTDHWKDVVFTALKAAGIDPEKIVGKTSVTLEGFEAGVRNHPTNLTDLIGAAFADADTAADAAVYGSGIIRLDDRLVAGAITQFDILRIFPFGGKLILSEMLGKTVIKMLDQGVKNQGSGGYLQTSKITRDEPNNIWMISGVPIKDTQPYKILINEYLLTGAEHGLDFLGPNTQVDPVRVIHDSSKVQDALSHWLSNH
jgi:5'-nucleotidase / UDP-sugar diphosphatase